MKFPPYEMRTLSNGMQVIAVLHHEQPAVSMRLLVRAGSAHDPPGKAGTAYLAGSLLDQGTTSRSATDIAERIDTAGGLLSVGAGTDLSFVNFGSENHRFSINSFLDLIQTFSMTTRLSFTKVLMIILKSLKPSAVVISCLSQA